MSNVFVVDTNKQPLNTIHPGEARLLLNRGKAAVLKRYPFTVILKVAIDDPVVADLRIKIDPGSKTTGIAIMNDATGEVVFAAELSHRGQQIKKSLDDRRGMRRGRRARHTRYRKARWKNRRNKKAGWLAPSLQSRISNIITWAQRLARVCHITAISLERVKFDMQLLENPEISGVEYQQGTLEGYEIREYLLEKWGRKCTYCGKENVPLQIEHIHPRAKLGTDRISNLCLACEKCNIAKGTKDIRDFLKKKPELLKKILAQAKAPLRDAAAVNTTRKALFERLEALGLPIECGSGGLTKFNRTMQGLPKTHWIDAACVGKSTPETVQVTGVRPLTIAAYGHGCWQMCLMTRYGFPRTGPKAKHFKHGFKRGISSKPLYRRNSRMPARTLAEYQQKRGPLILPQKQERSHKLGKIIAESSNELTGTGTLKGVREEGLNPACGLLSFLPMAKARGHQKGRRDVMSIRDVPREIQIASRNLYLLYTYNEHFSGYGLNMLYECSVQQKFLEADDVNLDDLEDYLF